MPKSEVPLVETPLMKQYYSIKAKHPDALLLFRVGDFYETFGEDAKKTSEILGIVLTRRANGAASFVELAGFPYHALDTYLPRLVKAGQRVAICEQLEDPKLTKKIVKRGVTELVTPGIAFSDKVLDHKENNFLAALHLSDDVIGIAFLDVSTGEFMADQGKAEYIDKLLQSFRPSEVVIQKNQLGFFKANFGGKFFTTTFEDWVFTREFADDLLLKHFGTVSFKGFGIDTLHRGIVAAGAVMHYLSETRHQQLAHISRVSRIDAHQYVWLDKFTIRNLEILHSPNENASSLLQVLDHTATPMGSRLLKRWIVLPLKDLKQITERHEVVGYLIGNRPFSEALGALIRQIGDLERLISKVAVGKVNPREVIQLQKALEAIEPLRTLCSDSGCAPLKAAGDQLNPCVMIRERIARELKSEPSLLISKGNVIASGVSAELDELRSIAYAGKDYLAGLRQREIERTGIQNIKISYNNVFGYYIEVTNTHRDKVPSDWERKQTLVNCERYITPELKEYESKILAAEDLILQKEEELYNALVLAMQEYIGPIQANAVVIGRLDVLLCFAVVAMQYNYSRPEINDSFILDIKGGRHPVIEQHLPPGEEYVANDVYLDNDSQQIIIVTGPNMSGKSALLRQTALIVLMAQMGSYVPAEKASIGLIDKIFTRVGASDNISLGESTFMVEMNETASILNNVTNRSLILLDEIGRGTSTYDGISIAWAIAEFLHEHPMLRAKTLFATHYHELNEMAAIFFRIKNFNVSIKEYNNKIIFLRKLVPGGSEHSFGIHVARMAGMPARVIERANQIMARLEKEHSHEELIKTTTDPNTPSGRKKENYQLSIFQLDDPLLEQIKEDILNIDINTLTPVEALMKLNEIKRLLGK
ncbi:MAG TPA: DNA mismatch repair protein MutS [Bacteroidales bacterium]|nr:DNA mismatch repair protein MutS [Bacteroidales bacterium]